MKKPSTIIILFSILGVLLLVYFIFNSKNEKRYQWNQNYKASSDQPYGTLFIKSLLQNYRPGEQFIYNDKKPLKTLLDSSIIKDADYIFIGQNLNIDADDRNALLKFIQAGNDAFVASLYLPFDLIDTIYNNECNRKIFLEEHEVLAANLNFYHKTLQTKKGYNYAYRYGAKDHPYFWNTLNREIFCDSTKSIFPLGYQRPDQVNFIKLPFGKGSLYIYTNPLVFTNYFISKPDQAEYAAKVFSHLRGKSIIWDEFSKANFGGNNDPYNSPLSYILQFPSLKYAWWMILICAILYTLFAAKRKQRVIPVLEGKANTSLEFINMISALHFQNGNHLDIGRKKMKYFLYFIRAKYGIHATHFSEAHFIRLAEKSKVDIKDIQLIFNEYGQMERYIYDNADKLVKLYNAIENFYKHCK